MTGFSSGVSGENQTKLKENFWVRHGEDVVFRGEDVLHGEGYCSTRKRESCLKYQSQVCHDEDIVCRDEPEERIYVSILVSVKADFLATILKHASSSPTHKNQYIYSKINSRFVATVSSISLEQYLIDAIYHHTHTSTLPNVGLEPPWSTNAMSWL